MHFDYKQWHANYANLLLLLIIILINNTNINSKAVINIIALRYCIVASSSVCTSEVDGLLHRVINYEAVNNLDR